MTAAFQRLKLLCEKIYFKVLAGHSGTKQYYQDLIQLRSLTVKLTC